MSAIKKISFYQNRRDEVPNQKLAHELAQKKDKKGIQEIAENLWNSNKNVRSDCLKVLYEIGYINPGLIENYVNDFLKLLNDKENRMVWGSMIGLATIADKRPKEIWEKKDDVISTIQNGTLITVVWGVKTLAKVAAADKKYSKKIFPILISELKKCLPRDIPMHTESMMCAINKENRNKFIEVIEKRQKELTASQSSRLKKVMKLLPS